jgi:hypothetical protein
MLQPCRQRSTAFELQIGRSWHAAIRAIYIAQGRHGITQAKKTHEVRPAVLSEKVARSL